MSPSDYMNILKCPVAGSLGGCTWSRCAFLSIVHVLNRHAGIVLPTLYRVSAPSYRFRKLGKKLLCLRHQSLLLLKTISNLCIIPITGHVSSYGCANIHAANIQVNLGHRLSSPLQSPSLSDATPKPVYSGVFGTHHTRIMPSSALAIYHLPQMETQYLSAQQTFSEYL